MMALGFLLAATSSFAETTAIGDPEISSFKLESLKSTSRTQSESEMADYRERYQRLFNSKDFKRSLAKLVTGGANSNTAIDERGRELGRIRIGPVGEILDFDDAQNPKVWGLTPTQGLRASRDPYGSIFVGHIHNDIANKQAHTIIGSIPGQIVENATGSSILGTITSTAVMVIHEAIPDPRALRNSKGHRIADMDPADMTGNAHFSISARANVGCQYALDGSGACTITLLTGGSPREKSKEDPRKVYSGMSSGIR